ncbi:MAG TPA: hypothetical protein VK208_09380 [Pyrinomonadaceae bacterium]|jgi:hypothetical protein|nr:hypothetical protein [Pyrinomonadaceae bacterium]
MRVALGLKAHSGWAALIALGLSGKDLEVVDRRRLELVEEGNSRWARQPYHAAEGLSPDEARELVKRGTAAAYQTAAQELKAEVKRLRELNYQVVACGLIVGQPMPKWATAEILAVHFRMHQAEGVLFRDALVRAAKKCRLALVAIPEKLLTQQAEQTLAMPMSVLAQKISILGKSLGPPWRKDHKDSALAAMIALKSFRGKA